MYVLWDWICNTYTRSAELTYMHISMHTYIYKKRQNLHPYISLCTHAPRKKSRTYIHAYLYAHIHLRKKQNLRSTFDMFKLPCTTAGLNSCTARKSVSVYACMHACMYVFDMFKLPCTTAGLNSCTARTGISLWASPLW